jgi:hypothetical protein
VQSARSRGTSPRTALVAVVLVLMSLLVAGPAQALPGGQPDQALTGGPSAADISGEAVIAIVRNDIGVAWEVDSRTGIYHAGLVSWGWCPGGYIQVGQDFHSNGGGCVPTTSWLLTRTGSETWSTMPAISTG